MPRKIRKLVLNLAIAGSVDKSKEEGNMAKLGTEKRPIVVCVHTEEKAKYVAETCAKNGWHYIIGFEPDKPEDISDLEKMLNPEKPKKTNKISRNSPCPCGSGKKYKKCCGASGVFEA